jgi:WD40 repeat protein
MYKFCILSVLWLGSLPMLAQSGQTGFFRNLSQVITAAYSPDGSLLTTISRDSVYLWKTEEKISLWCFKVYDRSRPGTLVFGGDSSRLFSAGADKVIRVWQPGQSNEIKTLSGHLAPVTALAASPDGKTLASVSEDVSMRLWDANTLQPLRIFYGHKGKLSAVAFSPDSRYVATAGEDKLLIVQEVKTGNIIRKMAFNQLKWIRSLAFSPDSKSIVVGGDYHMVSVVSGWLNGEIGLRELILTNTENTVSQVSFLANGSLLAVATSENNIKLLETKEYKIVETLGFRTSKLSGFAVNKDETELLGFAGNRGSDKLKDLNAIMLAANLKAEPKKANLPVQTAARQQLKNENDITSPQILIISPRGNMGNKISLTTETAVIKGQILDDFGVFKTLMNGQEISLSPEGIFEIELKMVFGENLITLEALDAAGNTSIKKIIINRTQASTNDVEFNPVTAKNYLFIIGIDQYKYWKPLSNAVNDSQDLKFLLNNKYTFDDNLTFILNNEEATRRNIYEKFKEIIGKIRGNDNLMIYFSGHGHYDPGLKEGYWIPVDAQQNNDSDYIPNSYLLSLIRRMEAKHIFVVADACFSGALFAESNRGYMENVEQLKSRWALASGRLEYVSDGSAGQHSPFAKVLIDFLKDTKKPRFPVSELVQFVKVETANISSQTPIGNPLKSIGDEGGEFIFYKRIK